jgi:RHS repeat-associated protein
LISAATESNLVLFAYDGRHRCVKRLEIQSGVGRTTIMTWGHEPSQGWGLLEERGANGALLARHVHGPSVDELVLSELNGAVYYYHQDHLNSTVAVTDENGNVVEQYRYDAYGQPYFYGPDSTPRAESALGLRFLFTGREWLASLGLYDYRHRLYSPSLGRFLQMDPLGFAAGDVNFYRHAHNCPCRLLDPLGLCDKDGETYVRKYVEDLRKEWYIFLPWLWARAIDFSREHDIQPEKGGPTYYRWRGYRLRADEMGNAAAAYAMAEVWGFELAHAGCFMAEAVFAVVDKGWTLEDMRGSFRSNSLGMCEWLCEPSGRFWLESRTFIANWY